MSEILQYFLLLKTKFTRVILSANFINGLSYKKNVCFAIFLQLFGTWKLSTTDSSATLS